MCNIKLGPRVLRHEMMCCYDGRSQRELTAECAVGVEAADPPVSSDGTQALIPEAS